MPKAVQYFKIFKISIFGEPDPSLIPLDGGRRVERTESFRRNLPKGLWDGQGVEVEAKQDPGVQNSAYDATENHVCDIAVVCPTP